MIDFGAKINYSCKEGLKPNTSLTLNKVQAECKHGNVWEVPQEWFSCVESECNCPSHVVFTAKWCDFIAAKTCGPPPEGVQGVGVRVLKTGQSFGQNCSTNGDWLDVSGCEECGEVKMMRMR